MAQILTTNPGSLRTGPETSTAVATPWNLPTAESREFDISYYWYLLQRRRWQIFTLAVVATAMITLLTLALPKRYHSDVLIRVDPQGRNVVGEQNATNGSSGDATLLVSTEAQVVTSPAVVSALIQKMNLANNPEFRPAGYQGGALTPLQQNRLMRDVTRDISVGQPIGTLLLSIGFTARDPNLAAQAANTLSQVYLEHEYTTRATALSDASRNMRDELDGLRAEMERSQSDLINYESTHDVIDPDDKNNIYQARLSQINAALSSAEASRIGLEAEYAIARPGNQDALAATEMGAALKPLRAQLETDQRKLGELATVYGSRHPLYVQQQKVVQFDQEQMQRSAQHISHRIGSQFQAAALRERLLQGALAREKSAMDAFNMRAIKYHSLKAASDSATQLYFDLQKNIQDSTVAAGLHSEELRIISPAVPRPIPVFPRPLLYGSLAFLASLGLAITGVIVSGILDRSVSTPEQAEQRLRVRVIATLPVVKMPQREVRLEQYGGQEDDNPTVLSPLARHTPFEEAILELHSALRFAGGENVHVLAISSSVPGEGKSTIAANLAAAAAAVGTRTILIDADLRKPNLHRLFRLPNLTGLSSILRQQQSISAVLQKLGPNLSVMTAGPCPLNPAELLHQELAATLEQVRNQADWVIVDCPPALGLADAAIVASLADGCLLIANAGKTTQDLVAAALRQLNSVRAHLLGLVLNRVDKQVDHYYSYYHTAQDYYRSGDADEANDVELG